MQSLLFPGLGLSRATGQPHWLRGVAGYGCMISAIAFNQISKSSYENYKGESDIGTRDDLYDSSVSQDGVSETFAYAAIGIWVTDIIWNFIGSSRLAEQPYVQERKIKRSTRFDPALKAPMLAFELKF